VAAFALHQMGSDANRETVAQALRWLSRNINPDGGWGDTPDSPSNLSTTLLGWAALGLTGAHEPEMETAAQSAGAWIAKSAGSLEPGILAQAVVASYGNDRTFSAPILTVCALAGRLGDDPWKWVPQLPFEWSVLPRGLFRFARLEVVSYALPALIAIGLVRHRCAPPYPGPVRWLRQAVTPLALRLLRRCQPVHGGFLEAAPLNGFVAASLAAAGLREHPVARDCAGFLVATVRPDGSWPIDTNLATWLTTLSINALAVEGDSSSGLSPAEQTELRAWLMGQQSTRIHPFTQAAAGGWGWTVLPGAVPDADDTAGALLALFHLGADAPGAQAAARRGIDWLLGIQNGDGGIPTFCRGWGRLPFDRSCPDITAHALVAFDAWYAWMEPGLRRKLDVAIEAGVHYLTRVQQADGSWLPLWFGNQMAPRHANPTYGTAHVVRALSRLTPGRLPERGVLVGQGAAWLLKAQNEDGGWGGAVGTPSTVEETALAIAALNTDDGDEAAGRGAEWLVKQTHQGTRFEPAPIGLYFARLWYSERLYPVIFTLRALAGVAQRNSHLNHGENQVEDTE
jgi:squalene-hopene/tetraprenyl-beta-curcumene cyclase